HHEMLINLSTDGCIYLLLQFLSWVFHWSKGIFILIIMVVVSLILRIDIDLFVYGKAKLLPFELSYNLFFSIRSWVINKPLEVLFITTLVIWHLCLLVIKLYRHNVLTTLSFPFPSFPNYNLRRFKIWRFRSPHSALIWYEFKAGGFTLILTFILLWLLIVIGNMFFSGEVGRARLLSFDFVSLLKHYTSWSYRDFALVDTTIIALVLAILYYWLRVSLRYGPDHPKYTGLIRFLPVNNFERVNAYLLVLSINVLLICIFLGTALFLVQTLSEISQPSEAKNLLLQEVKEVFSKGGIIYSLLISEGLIVLVARIMFIGLLIFALVASKEVLLGACLYLLLYGFVNAVAFYNSYDIRGINYPLGGVYKILSPWFLSIERYLNPLWGNYCLLYILLFIYFLYIAVVYRLLKRKEVLFLSVVFTLVFISVYPWLFRYSSWGEVFFQIKVHIFLATIVVLPFLSNLLALQGHKWKSLKLQVISLIGMDQQVDSRFFWKTKIPLLVMMVPLFVFRMDPWYLTEYGLGESLSFVRAKQKEEFAGESNKIREKFEKLGREYQGVLNSILSKGGAMVMFCDSPGRSHAYWTYFFYNEHKQVPLHVYETMLQFYNEYGLEIGLKIREFLKETRSFSEGVKEYFRWEEFEGKWEYASSLCDLLLIEAYLRGMSGDNENMMDSLRLIKELSSLVSPKPLHAIIRVGGMINWLLHHTEVPECVIDEFLRIWGELASGNYEKEYEHFKTMALFEVSQSVVSPMEYWDKKELRGVGQTWSELGSRGFDLLPKVITNIEKLISTFPEIKRAYYPVMDLTTLDRFSEREEKLLYYESTRKMWEDLLRVGYFEKSRSYTHSSNTPVIYQVSYPIFGNLRKLTLAIEKYRIRFGKLPDTLDELVPEFLDTLPCDPWNEGLDFTYRKLEPLGFVVYSFGRDFRDDGGFSHSQLHESSRIVSDKKYTYDFNLMIPPSPFRRHGFIESSNIVVNKKKCSLSNLRR
ncbi:MAG: hypothetical protein N3G21_11340, partial [Candidatus Hydrogenedentes bacterium]|nr:hypothetical protein [Candidatus Hydrogenedentota bacterium]